ncbi:MAG TPA: metallopeptidase TldD-related protein [Polyangiaceae bacterium]
MGLFRLEKRRGGGRPLLACACLLLSCGGTAPAPAPPAHKPSARPAVPPAFSLAEPRSEAQVAPPQGMSVLGDEIARAMKALAPRGELAPYFIGQELTAYDLSRISATNGGLTTSNRVEMRTLMTDVRVGEHEFDSTHPVDGQSGEGGVTMAPVAADAHDALRYLAWQQIDQVYESASERFLEVKSQSKVRVGIEDRTGDFSREQAVVHIGPPPPPLEHDAKDWELRVRMLSARLRDRPGIHGADASLEAFTTLRWIVNSEGTRIQSGERYYRLTVSAHTRADDGMELEHREDFIATSQAGLPSEVELVRAVDRLGTELDALRVAKPAAPFVGPAILAGRAAGVFFHETFGHRVEGERQKFEEEGQTFAKKLEERVMPAFLNVYDDPRLTRLGDVELSGFYRFDDEGVPAQRASLVEAGILKGFLMSRVPVRGVLRSNGHGRRMSGAAMGRQANLVIEPTEVVASDELRRLLIAEVKRQKKPYGLYFTEVEGGYTETDRFSTQGYKLLPVIVYRVFPDGKPDELIRGVDIVGTPLVSLTKVLAADDRYAVFNGICGAESGWIPVSAVSPSLLVQQIEVALREKGDEKPPILPPPPTSPGAR